MIDSNAPPQNTEISHSYMKWAIINVLVVLFLLVVLEGMASLTLAIRNIGNAQPPTELAERRHTKHDSDLGWVNKPNAFVPDMYGPGAYLRTNNQGFRNNRDFERTVPPGSIRVVCSGNSFTLGYGVSNDHTWCQLLEKHDQRLETVNMGQGGYGVDQAYLWHKRDTAQLDHDIHILAFITDDFNRMKSTVFLNHPKPFITIQNGALKAQNTPVPQSNNAHSRWSEHLEQFRLVQMLGKIKWQIGSLTSSIFGLEKRRIEHSRQVVGKIFSELNSTKKRTLVLVYLPTLGEAKEMDAHSRDWFNFIEKKARASSIPFIDALAVFRSLPPSELVEMFVPLTQTAYPGAGHLNERGNQFVARVIYEQLKTLPAIQGTAR